MQNYNYNHRWSIFVLSNLIYLIEYMHATEYTSTTVTCAFLTACKVSGHHYSAPMVNCKIRMNIVEDMLKRLLICTTLIVNNSVSSYCIGSVEHIHSGFHQTQCFVDTHSLERTHLLESRKGLDYYMLDDILAEVHTLCTPVHQWYIVVLQ